MVKLDEAYALLDHVVGLARTAMEAHIEAVDFPRDDLNIIVVVDGPGGALSALHTYVGDDDGPAESDAIVALVSAARSLVVDAGGTEVDADSVKEVLMEMIEVKS